LSAGVEQISPQQLQDWLSDASKTAPVLLDVREPWEFSTCHIAGSLSMPMQTVPARLAELQLDAPHVVICHHGGRSQQVAMFLERNGFAQLYNLAGGVDAWSRTVDPTLPQY
jgi:rhodanese-related sulfurtransferase